MSRRTRSITQGSDALDAVVFDHERIVRDRRTSGAVDERAVADEAFDRSRLG